MRKKSLSRSMRNKRTEFERQKITIATASKSMKIKFVWKTKSELIE